MVEGSKTYLPTHSDQVTIQNNSNENYKQMEDR